MTAVYLLDTDRATIGRLDPAFQSLTTKRRYQGASSFSLTLNRNALYANEVTEKRLIYLPDDGHEVYLVEQIMSVAEGSSANEEMTVSGRDVGGFAMQERRVVPPPGQAHDAFTGPAESLIKHYVNEHAGPDAAATRQVPGLIVAPDAAQGATVTAAGRYRSIEDVVREPAAVAGMGWRLTLDPDTREFVLDTLVGVDRSASVFFDFAFQTLEQWVELISLLDSKTFAIVAGQGEGADREVVTRWVGSEPTGFDRRETLVDARDVELGNTALLNQRGDAVLLEAGSERRLEARAHQYGAFRYREDWEEGDIVLARNTKRGLALPTRVVEVERTWKDSAVAPVVVAVLGRPLPTLGDRVAAGGGGPIIDYALGGVLALSLLVDALGNIVSFSAGSGGLVTP